MSLLPVQQREILAELLGAEQAWNWSSVLWPPAGYHPSCSIPVYLMAAAFCSFKLVENTLWSSLQLALRSLKELDEGSLLVEHHLVNHWRFIKWYIAFPGAFLVPQACVSCCRVPKDGPTTSSVARTSSLPASALAGDGISSALTLSVVLLMSCYLHVPESFQVQKQRFLFFFFPRQVLAAVDLSPIPLPAKTFYCTGPCFVSQVKQAFHRYLGVSWVKSVQDETQNCDVMCCFVCLLSSLLHRLDVGRKWCVVQAEEEERKTWGDEWVNVCTLLDVSGDLEPSHGCIPWLLMSDLSTGFCKCAKGINSVFRSSSAAILLSLEGWDAVHLYWPCYFWLSVIWGHH